MKHLMESIIKLKHWQLFLIVILATYLIRTVGLFTVVVFELIVYTLWIYTLVVYSHDRVNAVNHEYPSGIFLVSCFLMPLFWIVSYFSIPVISIAASVLWLVAMVFNIYFITKVLKKANAEINQIWIALGLLLPFIGVWYIQPLVNRLYINKGSVPVGNIRQDQEREF